VGVRDREPERHDRILGERVVWQAVVAEFSQQLLELGVDFQRPLLEEELELGQHRLLGGFRRGVLDQRALGQAEVLEQRHADRVDLDDRRAGVLSVRRLDLALDGRIILADEAAIVDHGPDLRLLS
jgi:hypothetical protein